MNLPTEIARKYVEERGVANYVEVPEPVVGDTPAVIEGVFSAKIELPFAQKEE